MIGKFDLPSLGKTCLVCALSLPAVARGEVQSSVLEIAPLQGAMGQLGVRGEMLVRPKWAAAITFDSTQHPSERFDATDRADRIGGELLWYPEGRATYAGHGPFFGVGAAYEVSVQGRQQIRDSRSMVRTNADERYDRWANEDRIGSATAHAGYRVSPLPYLTTSLRMTLDYQMWATEQVIDREIHSQDVDESSKGREPIRRYISLHAGFAIP